MLKENILCSIRYRQKSRQSALTWKYCAYGRQRVLEVIGSHIGRVDAPVYRKARDGTIHEA